MVTKRTQVLTKLDKLTPSTATGTPVSRTTTTPVSSTGVKKSSVASGYTPQKSQATSPVRSTSSLVPKTATPAQANASSYTPTKSTTPVAASTGNSYSPPSGGGGADSQYVSDRDARTLARLQEAWGQAGTQQEKDLIHQQAEGIRSKYGYSGGESGGQHVQLDPKQQEVQAQAVNSVDSVMTSAKQLTEDAKSMGTEGLIAISAQWDKMVAMLDSVQAQITDQIKGQMNGDDPAMQEAIRVIKQEAETMRQSTLEELNSRGLVQSGVYAKALSDMNSNELTQIQSTVASRFGDLQTQLNNAIMSLAQTRISALGANQSAAVSMMTNTQNNIMNAGLAGLNAAVTTRGQDMQQRQASDQLKYNYANMAQDQKQFDSTLSFNREQLAQSNQQFYDKLSQDNKQFYDQLSQSEKLGYAQIAASRGAQAAADTLAERKFAWEQQTYNTERQDQMNATNQANTYAQVGQASMAGGFVEQAIAGIRKGTATLGQVRTSLEHGGYTSEAQAAILSAIIADPGVKKAISTPYAPKSPSASVSYTPPIKHGRVSNWATPWGN